MCVPRPLGLRPARLTISPPRTRHRATCPEQDELGPVPSRRPAPHHPQDRGPGQAHPAVLRPGAADRQPIRRVHVRPQADADGPQRGETRPRTRVLGSCLRRSGVVTAVRSCGGALPERTALNSALGHAVACPAAPPARRRSRTTRPCGGALMARAPTIQALPSVYEQAGHSWLP